MKAAAELDEFLRKIEELQQMEVTERGALVQEIEAHEEARAVLMEGT